MKKLFSIIPIFLTLLVVGCTKPYDDSEIRADIADLQERVEKLEEMCREMNTNISALQTIVEALQNNVYVVEVNTTTDGYVIIFSDGTTATIANGRDGANGENGTNAPVISVKQGEDGNYYWTLDGEWLLVDGERVRANGHDGENGAPGTPGNDAIAPQIRINDQTKMWEISTDGGQTWSLPTVNMDSGPGMDNGCGDPCILQDKKGRIWMQALACHFAPGARAINASGTGTAVNKTGQWEMVYSDDEGKTWSEIMNVTEQVKKDEWHLILAGPGNGICKKDGTIVFPAQIWQHNANPNCRSTICYSADGGKTWKMGTGVPAKTSECQVVELQDGSLMLNCRNEAYGGKRIVYVTKDMGETWEAHESNSKTLNDPTCQASLVTVDSKKYGRLLLFSNPWIHGRSNMSIRASRDEGVTWSDGVLYDARGCMGYSCIAMTDPDHVGIIYETCHKNGETDYRGIGFIRLPLQTIVTGEEAEVKAPVTASDGKKAKKAKKTKKGKKSKKKKKA